MKKLSIFLIMLVAVSFGYSQSDNLNRFPSKLYQKDTLTTLVDTLDVSFNSDLKIQYFVVTAKTTAGADTVQVWVLASDQSTWVQQAVVDLSDLSSYANIVASTTAKDFILADPYPSKIRLISTSNDASTTIVIVSGRVINKGE